MVRSIEGIYKDGKVELLETAPDLREGRVIVTFLQGDGPINLAEHGIMPEQAGDLRHRLKTFRDHWDTPEMDVYNDL